MGMIIIYFAQEKKISIMSLKSIFSRIFKKNNSAKTAAGTTAP